MAQPQEPTIISIDNAEHYRWGGKCDGWFLAKSAELTLIQERVPPGGAEMRHYHQRAWQFFFVLSGAAVLEVEGRRFELGPQQGLEVQPGMAHQLRNEGDQDLHFLVVSRPNSHGDRVAALLDEQP